MMGTMLRQRMPVIAMVLVALAIAGGLAVVLHRAEDPVVYYVRAAQRMRDGEPIHRLEPCSFTYPPLFAVPFMPLLYVPTSYHPAAYYFINVMIVMLIVSRLWRLLRRDFSITYQGPVPGRVWLFWGLLILLAGRHVTSPIENSSHDLLLFLSAWLAIEAWCAGRQLGAGVFAGLGGALKATPLLFLLLFVGKGSYRAIAALVVAGAAFFFLPDLLYPAADGQSWVLAWYHTFLKGIAPGEAADAGAAWISWNPLNQSLSGSIHRLFVSPPPWATELRVNVVELPPLALRLTILTAQLAVVGWLFWIARLGRGLQNGAAAGRQRLGEGAAFLCGMVLLSPMSSKAHFCVLLVPLAYCLADFLFHRRDALVGFALLLNFVLGTLSMKGLIGRAAGDLILAAGSVNWCTAVLLLAVGRILYVQARQSAAKAIPTDAHALSEQMRAAA